MSWYFGVKSFPCKTYLLWTFLDSATVKEIVNTTLDYFGLISQPDQFLNPAVCSMLFQLPILLPENFPARSSKPVFLSLCRSNVWKLCRLVFPRLSARLCQLFFEQAGELGVKLRHVVHETDRSVLFLLMFQIWYLRKWMITSISQNLHMRVTRFKSLWVSDATWSKHFRRLFYWEESSPLFVPQKKCSQLNPFSLSNGAFELKWNLQFRITPPVHFLDLRNQHSWLRI